MPARRFSFHTRHVAACWRAALKWQALANGHVTTATPIWPILVDDRFTMIPEFVAPRSDRFTSATQIWQILVDDRFPLARDGRPMCSHSSHAEELWVSIIEKAYMKASGGFTPPTPSRPYF